MNDLKGDNMNARIVKTTYERTHGGRTPAEDGERPVKLDLKNAAMSKRAKTPLLARAGRRED
jgi:hypothetical protein